MYCSWKANRDRPHSGFVSDKMKDMTNPRHGDSGRSDSALSPRLAEAGG